MLTSVEGINYAMKLLCVFDFKIFKVMFTYGENTMTMKELLLQHS